ncbi:MAG: SLC13 family permease [Candidatus Promineifilaceae bacterium]|nr:SLC13 family permease [Candidatus Promineifilaceae bacterium]
MIITFIILFITLALFIWGRWRADFVAFLALIALYLFGVLDTEQALSGFSNMAVIMMGALFVVGEGLTLTGISSWLGEQFVRVGGESQTRLLVVLLLGTAVMGAFVSSFGAIAIMLPIVIAASWRMGSTPSRFLIPLSFVGVVGGLLTLVSMAPNIIVSDLLANLGLRPFGFFEFGLIGVPLLVTAVVFMVTAGRRLLPEQRGGQRPVNLAALAEDLAADYDLKEELFLLRVRFDSLLVGKTLAEAQIGELYKVSVLRIDHMRERVGSEPLSAVVERLRKLHVDDQISVPGPASVVEANDVLLVLGRTDHVHHLATELKLGLEPLREGGEELQHALFTQEVGLAEIIIAPRSQYVGQTIAESRLSDFYNAQVLNIVRQGHMINLRTSRLQAGDVLLVRATWDQLELFKSRSRNFVVIGSPEAASRQVVEIGPRSVTAVVALLVMIILMISGWVTPVMATIIAAAIMVLGRSLTVEQATRAISLRNVLLLAALLPMSIALQVTGGAELIANVLVRWIGPASPIFLLAGIFLLTSAFAQVISVTASTVLIAPITLEVALDLGYNPHAFMIIVVVAAATAFLTPFATSTNLMVMTPGGYQFSDYTRIGLPLLLVIMIVSLILVPLIWPL